MSPVLTILEVRTLETKPLGVWSLDGVWKGSLGCLDVNSRCPDDVCNELGVWNVSRGCKECLKKVLTIWCPNLSVSKVRTLG